MKTSQETLVPWILFGLIAAVLITVSFGCNLGGSSPPPTSQSGTLDATFLVTGVGANNSVSSVVVEPSDGKILIGGQFTAYNNTSLGYVTRLNTDGSLDSGFASTGTGNGANNPVLSVATQSDGKILIGGYFDSYNSVTVGHGLARLDTGGSLDTSFSSAPGWITQ